MKNDLSRKFDCRQREKNQNAKPTTSLTTAAAIVCQITYFFSFYNFFFSLVSLQSKITAAQALLANDATAAQGVEALKAIINEETTNDVAKSSNDITATDNGN